MNDRLQMNRRGWLKGLAALGVAAWAPPAWAQGAPTANQRTPGRVLEINLDGGLSTFETIAGRPAGNSWQQDFYGQMPLGTGTSPYQWVTGLYDDDGKMWWHTRSLRNAVLAGDWALRISIMSHNLEPHPAARPLLHTGTTLGRPRHASSGAWASLVQGRTPADYPAGFVVHAGAAVAARDASAVRGAGGAHKPVVVECTSGGVVGADLLQANWGADPLLGMLRSRYRGRFSRGPSAVEVEALDAYEGAAGRAEHSSGFASALASTTGTALERQLQAAAAVLRDSAQYACVIDTGYDTHGTSWQNGDSHRYHNDRLADALNALASVSLPSDTVVILTTEFGRKPENADPAAGTGHHPELYAQVALSPLGNRMRVREVIGTAVDPIHPTLFRGAVLEQLGVDASSVLATPSGAAAALRTRLFA